MIRARTKEDAHAQRQAHGARHGTEDHDLRREAPGPRPPDPALHRGGRHRPGHLARVRARPRRRGREGLRRQEADPVDGGLRGAEGVRQPPDVAPRRDDRRVPRVPRRHQGPAHDADRRRDPLAERRAPAAPRPLRLPPPRAVVPGRPVSREAPREGEHGHLPGEHRGHLRRHRVRGGDGRGAEARGVHQGELPGPVQEAPLPRDDGHRHQAGLAGGQRAPRPGGDRVRDQEQVARASRSSTRATS